MASSLKPRSDGLGDFRTDAGPYPVQELSRFLHSRQLVVVDVAPSVAPGCRRLLLGSARDEQVTFAAPVAHTQAAALAVDTEHEVLRHLADRLRPDLRQSVPHVVGRIRVGSDQVGLVVSGVPGVGAVRDRGPSARPRATLVAAGRWLAALWQDTAAEVDDIDLGRDAASALLSRYDNPEWLAPVRRAIHRSQERLEQHQVVRAAGHGCLCRRHVTVEGESVVGVDDWGRGAIAAHPLRDLGRLAGHLAGHRLPEVVAGQTSYAGTVRSFLRTGMQELGLPARLWRHVLVLTQVELAAEALDRGETDGVSRLLATVKALPDER
jgi:hypothetical protein